MKQVGISVSVALAVGCFALAATTTDSEGGIAWTAALVAIGASCLARAVAIYRSPRR
jgi:hypothetical protein